MKDFIMKLVKDFNEYSELVALNYSKMKEGKCDESTLQWNRGNLNRIEDYLKQLAESTEGVNLKWEYLNNKDTYVYENKTASQFIQMIAADFSLNTGTLEDTGFVIASRVEDNTSLFDIHSLQK